MELVCRGFGWAGGLNNWTLRGFCLLRQLPISDLLLKIGVVLKCDTMSIPSFPILYFEEQSSIGLVDVLSCNVIWNWTPALLLEERQGIAMLRNTVCRVQLTSSHIDCWYCCDMALKWACFPRDVVRRKKRANFLWDNSIGGIVLPVDNLTYWSEPRCHNGFVPGPPFYTFFSDLSLNPHHFRYCEQNLVLKKLWKVIGGGSRIQSMISTFEVLQSRGRTHHRTYPCLKQFSKLKWDLFQL